MRYCFSRWLVNSLHKGPVTRKIFPFDDIIMTTTQKGQRLDAESKASFPAHWRLIHNADYVCQYVIVSIWTAHLLSSIFRRCGPINSQNISRYNCFFAATANIASHPSRASMVVNPNACNYSISMHWWKSNSILTVSFMINQHWLTHWGRDKMDAISQTTFSNACSWMKMFEFRLKFHWSLFSRVQLTISQHWFR